MGAADKLLLNTLHSHSVVDSDAHFVIDPKTRIITSKASYPIVLMQYDHESERYTIELPHYIDNHDMSLCNRVRVHFNNIDSETEVSYEDVAELDAPVVDTENEDIVTVTWLVPRHATQYAGNLSFLIQFMCVDEEGNVNYEWHSGIFNDIEIKSGRNYGEVAVINYSNVLEKWYQKLFGTTYGPATANTLGLVKAQAKTDNDTTPITVDSDGFLWTSATKATKMDALTALMDTGTVDPMADENGAVYTDEAGNIYSF